MKVLVTGGAGFVGSRVCRALLHRGDSVVAIDNFDPFYPAPLKRGNLERLRGRGFRFVRGDIQHTARLRRLLRESRVGAVVHTAARPGVQASLKDPVTTFDVNARGTVSLVEAMEGSRVERVIFASSSTVYGKRGSGPRRKFREENAGEPISPYGASKVAAENYLRVFSEIRGFRYVALRLFTVYGPRMRPDLGLPTLVSRAARGAQIEIYGRPVRDFTHVDDAVAAFLRALDRGSGIYNIGGGRPVPIREVARTVVRLTGSRSRIVARPPLPGDMDYTWADISKARKELGWRPRVLLEDGLRNFVAWASHEGT